MCGGEAATKVNNLLSTQQAIAEGFRRINADDTARSPAFLVLPTE